MGDAGERSWFSMRYRALAALGVVAVVLPAIGGAWAMGWIEDALTARIRQGQLATATTLAAQIQQGSEFVTDLVRSTAERTRLVQAVDTRDASTIEDVLENAAAAAEAVVGFAVVVPDEGSIAEIGTFRTTPGMISIGESGRPGPPIITTGGDALFGLPVPIAGPSNASLVAQISFAGMAPATRELRFGRTGSATVVDRDGVVVVSGEPVRVGQRVVTEENRRLVEAWQPGTSRYFGQLVRREEIAGFTPAEGTNWAVFVSQATSEAFADLATLRTVLGLGLIGFVVVALVIVFLVVQAFDRYDRRNQERIEEQERLNRALQRLNQALDAYSGRVAHDVRGPLATVSMALALLEEERDGMSEQGREAFDIALRGSERAATLAHELLDLARASGSPRPVPIRVDALVREAAQDIPDIELSIEIEPDAAVILADRTGLRQVLSNLLSNASRYGRSNGRPDVTVRCIDENGGWRIEVADRGPGLQPADEATIFEPFRRGREIGGAGTGLGLSFVAAVAEAHGGRAWYEPRPGGGSVFCVTLTRPQEHDHDADPEPEAVPVWP